MIIVPVLITPQLPIKLLANHFLMRLTPKKIDLIPFDSSFINFTFVAYSRKVVEQCCEQYKNRQKDNDVIYKKYMLSVQTIIFLQILC